MSIFNSEVENLEHESNNIISVFSKTAKKLREVNAKIVKSKLERVKRLESLNLEIDSLTYAETKNERVASKIDEFLDN
jgi:hypothetical protein